MTQVAHEHHELTVVLDVTGMLRGSQQHTVETALEHRRGVRSVEANAAAQTATVIYDPDVTSVAELRGYVTDCGMHCAGQSVPYHVCNAMAEPGHAGHAPQDETAAPEGGHAHGAGHDMSGMVRD